MNYPLQAMIQQGVIPSVNFATDSRYYAIATQQYTAPDGTVVTYLARRLIPQPGPPNYSPIARHTVKSGDRLDLLAATYLGDPLMFWLICDANGAIAPDALVKKPGSVIAITMPQGIPGGTSA